MTIDIKSEVCFICEECKTLIPKKEVERIVAVRPLIFRETIGGLQAVTSGTEFRAYCADCYNELISSDEPDASSVLKQTLKNIESGKSGRAKRKTKEVV